MNTQAPPSRIKRLEVQGFKSFAARTVFDFGRGITAVVGPNGSGKSNVADAVRWVFGEQGTRALRLRKPEDVIFAGGGNRGPAGFAEVSITLDNADRLLPLDFAEVVATRRLHRSGESEYLINRRRVRLRDLVELFLAARLGQNSYAVLGQGSVDAVLSLRPEDRRVLIEDAADVRRFRLRIDEATAQLTETRVNRERAELVLGEIAPRLTQLSRQAKRAAEHGMLSARLAELLKLLALQRWREAAEQNASIRSQLGRAEFGLREGTERIRLEQRELAQLRPRLAAAREALAVEEAAGARLRERLRDDEHALVVLQERSSLLDQRQIEVAADLEELRLEAASSGSEADFGEPDPAAFEEAAATVATAEAAFERTHAPLAAAHEAYARAEAAQQRLDREAREADERAARVLRERRQLEHEAVRLAQRRHDALKRLAAWAQEFRQASQLARQLDARQPAAEKEFADLARQSHAVEAARDAQQIRLSDLDRSLENVRLRLAQLERERESRRPAEERLLRLLDALRGAGPGRPRVLGVLGGLIKVQRGLEVAIEAALAGALDSVVVRTSAEALGAVRALQEIEGGRLSFYALEAVPQGHALNLRNESGVVGVASAFVRCDEAYRNLIETLLGRMLVVESLEVAERLAHRGLGAVVTLDGVVLSPGGLIGGGRGQSDGHSFRAATELDDLREEVARLEIERAAAANALSEARLQARDAAERAKRAAEVYDDLCARRRAAEPAIARLRRRLEPLHGELGWLRSAARETRERIEGFGPDEDRIGTHVNRSLHAAQSHASALEGARAERDRLILERSALAAALETARTELRALERATTAHAVLRENRRVARDRSTRLLAARRQSLTELELRRESLHRELTAAAAAVAGSREALAGWPSRCAPQRDAVRSLAEHEAACVERLEALRLDLTRCERSRLEAELAMRSSDQQLRQAEEELERDAGIDATEAGFMPVATPCTENPARLEEQVEALRSRIRALGAVNAEAEGDYQETRQRHDALAAQVADLKQAEGSLLQAIEELRCILRERFAAAFVALNAGFERHFRGFFGGGQARLVLAEAPAGADAGVEIVAQPPGKRLQSLAMLSGGERSMTSVALLFALLQNDPAPFCVLDEVDAALDEANVDRVSASLLELSRFSQFLVITHNRGTVQAANRIYGVSMNADGVSSVLSLRLDDAAPLLQ
jgi:chromosome segregation protein